MRTFKVFIGSLYILIGALLLVSKRFAITGLTFIIAGFFLLL